MASSMLIFSFPCCMVDVVCYYSALNPFCRHFPWCKSLPAWQSGWEVPLAMLSCGRRLSAVAPAEHRAGAVAKARLHSQHLWLGQSWDDPGPSLTSHPAPGDRTAWEDVQPQYSIFMRPEALNGATSPSWEGWGPGTSPFDWPLHLSRAPTLFLSDEIKFFNIAIQVLVEVSAQNQDLSLVQLTGGWCHQPGEQEQREEPGQHSWAAQGCLDTRGTLLDLSWRE